MSALDRDALRDLAPLVRRVAALNPHAAARVRRGADTLTLLARLPFGVLVARTLPGGGEPTDATFRATDLLAWLDGDTDAPPEPRDLLWRGALPPADGWQRLERVPDADIRRVVRAGALALKDAAAREGVPAGTQPRKEVADALLDAVGLTVSDAGRTAEVSVRTLSALTRMGFLARDSHAFVDVHDRWIRVVGSYGTVYAETAPGLALNPR